MERTLFPRQARIKQNPVKRQEKTLLNVRQVLFILEELKEYKPLTVRQIFYQLVSKGWWENKENKYTSLSALLKWTRMEGIIPWEDIEDRSRNFQDNSGFYSSEDFIKQEKRLFLTGYRRNRVQTQKVFIELWIEKDALIPIITDVCAQYSVSSVACKGNPSISYLKSFCDRCEFHPGKKIIVLYCGDFDPTGIQIPKSIEESLLKMNIHNITVKRIALNMEDTIIYNLVPNYQGINKKDTNTPQFIKQYGTDVFELDGLRPDILTGKIRSAIEAEIDLEEYEMEKVVEEEDLGEIAELKTRILNNME